MQKRLKISLKNLSRFTRVLIFSSNMAFAVNGAIPVDNTRVRLPDGREVFSIRAGPNSHTIVLKQKQKVLWQKTFEYEYDRLWDYAFFVPIKKGRFAYDLNHTGYPKIAIATWDGGNAMDRRTALIFEVKANSLEYYTTHRFNLEYGHYVFP